MNYAFAGVIIILCEELRLMWKIMLSLIAGIAIGFFKFLPEGVLKYNIRAQQVGVVLLLFSMGASIGANRALLSNIGTLGIKALTYTMLSIFFSVAVLYIISGKITEGDKKE